MYIDTEVGRQGGIVHEPAVDGAGAPAVVATTPVANGPARDRRGRRRVVGGGRRRGKREPEPLARCVQRRAQRRGRLPRRRPVLARHARHVDAGQGAGHSGRAGRDPACRERRAGGRRQRPRVDDPRSRHRLRDRGGRRRVQLHARGDRRARRQPDHRHLAATTSRRPRPAAHQPRCHRHLEGVRDQAAQPGQPRHGGRLQPRRQSAPTHATERSRKHPRGRPAPHRSRRATGAAGHGGRPAEPGRRKERQDRGRVGQCAVAALPLRHLAHRLGDRRSGRAQHARDVPRRTTPRVRHDRGAGCDATRAARRPAG